LCSLFPSFFLFLFFSPLSHSLEKKKKMAKRVDIYSKNGITRDKKLLDFISDAGKREFDFHFLGNAYEGSGELAVFINFSTSRWVPEIRGPVGILQSI
jgi:hypothetical protein